MMIIAGMQRLKQLIVDASHGPVTFRHELATVPAGQRFNLPGNKDFVLALGYRAVIKYDDFESRNKILQVMSIPADDGAS